MALPDALSACNMCVELMLGTATTFTSYVDELSVIDDVSSTRMSGEAYVFGEDTAAVTFGKLEPMDITFRGVYTEGTTSPFYVLDAAHTTACGGKAAIRWSPGGCITTNRSFRSSTTVAKLISLTYPGGDSGSGDPLMYEATIRTPDVTEAAWA